MELHFTRVLSFRLFTSSLFLLVGLSSQACFAQNYMEGGDFVRGGKIWAENCSRCHNMRNAAELRDDQWVTSVFHMRVRAGLTGQETRDVLTYLQTSNVKIKETTTSKAALHQPAVPKVDPGHVIYENNCASCHGAKGRGSLPGVPDFNDKRGVLAKSDEELLNNIINGYRSPGSVFFMPPKGGNGELTPGDISAVLDHIKKMYSH